MFIRLKNILIKLRKGIFLSFSLKNIYVILLIALLPAFIFYVENFSYEEQSLCFLILGIILLILSLILLFFPKKEKRKILDLFLFLIFGFLGIRLIEFFLLYEIFYEFSIIEAMHFYTAIAFFILLVYLSIKIYKNLYTGRLVVFVAIVCMFFVGGLFNNVILFEKEKYKLNNEKEELTGLLSLYQNDIPWDWQKYVNDEYGFSFFYPPRFSVEDIEKNLEISPIKISEVLEGYELWEWGEPLDFFWSSRCIQKFSGTRDKKIISCDEDSRGRGFFFVQGEDVVRVFIDSNLLISLAEFDALRNSFNIYYIK